MKLIYPEINYVFDTDMDKVNTLVIENQDLLHRLVSDIYNQIEGNDGKTVISNNNVVMNPAKTVELLTQFVPFELSRKSLITKLAAELEKNATDSDMYMETMEVLAVIEKYLNELAFSVKCDPVFEKISINSIIKASGLGINEDYDSLGEKILDYFELITEYDCKKMFITLNLRSFLSDDELLLFLDDVLKRDICLIMIESCEYNLLPNEKRLLIDSDLCEVC